MPKFVKMEIKLRTVQISTASGLLQHCSRTAFQCKDTVLGYSIGIQDQYTVQDACECYLMPAARQCTEITITSAIGPVVKKTKR